MESLNRTRKEYHPAPYRRERLRNRLTPDCPGRGRTSHQLRVTSCASPTDPRERLKYRVRLVEVLDATHDRAMAHRET